MSGIRFSFPACVIAGKGRIDRHDVLILRKYAFPEGVRTYDCALLMLALDEMCPVHCREWEAYFVETLTTFIVETASPRGRLDELKSAWMIRTLGLGGAIERPLQLKFLMHAMERSGDYPDMLTAFALDQLNIALGDRPAGACHAGRPAERRITGHDLDYVWRILRKAVEDGQLRLTALERSVLHAIHYRVRDADNHPGWRELMEYVVSCERPVIRLRTRPWFGSLAPGNFDDTRSDGNADPLSGEHQLAMPTDRPNGYHPPVC